MGFDEQKIFLHPNHHHLPIPRTPSPPKHPLRLLLQRWSFRTNQLPRNFQSKDPKFTTQKPKISLYRSNYLYNHRWFFRIFPHQNKSPLQEYF